MVTPGSYELAPFAGGAKPFPHLAVAEGDAVPRSSVYWRMTASSDDLSDLVETQAGHWLQSDWSKPLPTLFEQVLYQQMGYVLILLWPELAPEDEDPDENRTSKQRIAERMAVGRRRGDHFIAIWWTSRRVLA